jgi:sporulation protein YlmC with PRC-barrel domain
LPALAAGAGPALVSASHLIGARVLDPHGAPAGTLHELAIDVAAGSVAYAVVDFRGEAVQDVGLRSVPLEAFQGGLARERLSLDPAPYLDWNAQLQVPPFARLLPASALLGMEVEQPSGIDYGAIRDVMLEFPGGQVRIAKLALDQAGEPLIELPFAALRFPPGGSGAVLNPAASVPDGR